MESKGKRLGTRGRLRSGRLNDLRDGEEGVSGNNNNNIDPS